MLLLLLFILPISSVYTQNCSYVFDGIQYAKKTILNIEGLPTNLVYNPNTNELLFTLVDLETLQNDDVQTKMDQYILKDDVPIKIDNINGQAAAVDVLNNKVYLASDKGLSVLNSSYKAVPFDQKEEDIVQIFKPENSDDLYTVIFPDNEVFVTNLKTHERRKIENVVCAFMLAVDANDNIFFECDSKYVKMLLKGFQEPIEFAGIPKNSARAIAMDNNNRVILAANDGLYWLKPDSVIPTKLMYLEFIPSGIAISGNKIFLSTNGMIYEYDSKVCV